MEDGIFESFVKNSAYIFQSCPVKIEIIYIAVVCGIYKKIRILNLAHGAELQKALD